MTWVRLDDGFYRHPKVVDAGPLGMAMQVAALCYCNHYLTDGFVPNRAVPGLLDLSGIGMGLWSNGMVGGGLDASWELVVEDLTRAGLWDEVDGGYRIHDFHDYQPTKVEVLEEREKARERQQKSRANRKSQRMSQRDNGVTHGSVTGAPYPYPAPNPPLEVQEKGIAVEENPEKAREVKRILGACRGIKPDSYGVLMSFASKVPFGSVVKVRESVESKPGRGVGYAVNALKLELQERASA